MRREPIPNDLFTHMCSLREQRDRLATKIGVTWLEFEKAKEVWKREILRIEKEEERAASKYLTKELLIDLDKTHVKANYDSGEFLIEE